MHLIMFICTYPVGGHIPPRKYRDCLGREKLVVWGMVEWMNFVERVKGYHTMGRDDISEDGDAGEKWESDLHNCKI